MLNFKIKHPIGIDIGSHNIYAVQLKKARNGLAVRAMAHKEFETEIDSIGDEEDALVAAVKKMTKNRQFRGKSVVIHIPVKNISAFPIRFQVSKTETLEEAIIRESQKYLSFPLKEAVIDYASIISETDSEGDTYRATIIAVRRKYIERYLRLMKQAGWVVEGVDYRVSSLVRLHQYFNPVTEHPVILCNVGNKESLLSIVTHNNILAQRVIPWGACLLLDKISANFELLNAQDNARLLLKNHGLAYDINHVANNTNQGSDVAMVNMERAVYQVITPSIDDLLHEFHTMISYVRSEQQQPAFEGIYLYGFGPVIRHLDRFLEKRLNIPTKSINPLADANISKDNLLPDVSEGAPFALAIGLAMREMKWL